MSRATLVLLVLASAVVAGDPPTFQGLSPDGWASRLADRSTRDEAGAALAAGGPEAIAVLDSLLRTRCEIRYLQYVIEGLPDARPLVPALVDLLADPKPEIRRSATLALWRIGPAASAAVPALVRMLSDADEETASDASGALGAIGAAAVPALTEALASPQTRAQAAAALARAGPEAASAFEPLCAILLDTSAGWRERGDAADALGEIGTPAAVAPLTRGLTDDEAWVRYRCAAALGKNGEVAAPAVPALLNVLADPDDSARDAAKKSLWQVGDPAIRALVEAFRASADRTLLGAALAAGRLSAIPYVVPLLADPEAPWHADAEAALALVGWEALDALPPDHPSASRVAHVILTEGVVRRVRLDERYRAVPAPEVADPEPMDATWETGSGHGFTLELYRGRWVAEGLAVRAIAYRWKRPRRIGEKEIETVTLRTTTIPRTRAEAMMRMVLATTRLTIEESGRRQDTSWSTSSDFHAALRLGTGEGTVYDEAYTGYSNSLNQRNYARVLACTEILDEGVDTCEWTETQPGDDDLPFLAARLGNLPKDHWWVRERLLLIVKAIGDARCLAPLEAFIATEPDETPRDHRYAIDAYAEISGIDLRPVPFDDRELAATRARYLARFEKR